MSDNTALLVLEDGQTFEGRAYGAVGETLGEIVFNTGMSGYQETVTDPSSYRQIVVMTAPHVGNTGMNDEDKESARLWLAGLVVRDPSRRASNWRSERTLDDDLEGHGIVGISHIDTRQLTRVLRDGVMRAGIFSGDALETDGVQKGTDELVERVRSIERMAGLRLADAVSTTEEYVVEPPEGVETVANVVAVDLGLKSATPEHMAERGLRVTVVPSSWTAEQILARKPDGVFFSNGPGDPSVTEGPVAVLRDILDAKVPFFGICLGHQLFGRALGYSTYKLKYGHRGINQPVKDLTTDKVEITAHNHGFAVDAPIEGDHESANGYGRVRVSHINLNDNVVEGLECLDIPAFSVQYHPEGGAGPHDAAYLFDRFVSVMKGER